MKALVLLLITGALVTAGAAPATAKPPRRCDQRSGDTVVRDAAHRIYVVVATSKRNPDNNETTVYSCAIGSSKKSVVLEGFANTIDGSESPVSGQLAGHWLLLDDGYETGTDAGYALDLFNLKTGKAVKGGLQQDGDDFADAALSASGAFAVLDADGGLSAYDSAGSHSLAPKAHALAVGGHYAYWTNPDGTPGSYKLAGAPTKI